MNKFIYTASGLRDVTEGKIKLIELKPKIVCKQELFDFYKHNLNFPDYFGSNWDALYDCLSDLSWIKEYIILIKHTDIPFENSKINQQTYLDLLLDVVSAWEENELHQVIVEFPAVVKPRINR